MTMMMMTEEGDDNDCNVEEEITIDEKDGKMKSGEKERRKGG